MARNLKTLRWLFKIGHEERATKREVEESDQKGRGLHIACSSWTNKDWKDEKQLKGKCYEMTEKKEPI